MLKWIVGSSLKYRFLVVAIAAGLMFFGVQQLSNSAVLDERRGAVVHPADL